MLSLRLEQATTQDGVRGLALNLSSSSHHGPRPYGWGGQDQPFLQTPRTHAAGNPVTVHIHCRSQTQSAQQRTVLVPPTKRSVRPHLNVTPCWCSKAQYNVSVHCAMVASQVGHGPWGLRMLPPCVHAALHAVSRRALLLQHMQTSYAHSLGSTSHSSPQTAPSAARPAMSCPPCVQQARAAASHNRPGSQSATCRSAPAPLLLLLPPAALRLAS